jgi:hypothetical protein
MIVRNHAHWLAAVAASSLTCGATGAAESVPAPTIVDTAQATSRSEVAGNTAFDSLATRYGNTVVVTAADGKETKLLFNRDGTLKVSRRGAAARTLHWSRIAGQFCISQDGAASCGAVGEEPETIVMRTLSEPAAAKPNGDDSSVRLEVSPPTQAASASGPTRGKAVGDAWTLTFPDGSQASARLVSGH